MIKIALTGSIGMGKSTVAAMFERAGVPVFDADAIVRSLQGPGGALVERIGEHFPGTVRDGVLDRVRLAGIVLEDPARLGELESIVHPAVYDARLAFLDKHRDAPALRADASWPRNRCSGPPTPLPKTGRCRWARPRTRRG